MHPPNKIDIAHLRTSFWHKAADNQDVPCAKAAKASNRSVKWTTEHS
jgi:hypothetical protein